MKNHWNSFVRETIKKFAKYFTTNNRKLMSRQRSKKLSQRVPVISSQRKHNKKNNNNNNTDNNKNKPGSKKKSTKKDVSISYLTKKARGKITSIRPKNVKQPLISTQNRNMRKSSRRVPSVRKRVTKKYKKPINLKRNSVKRFSQQGGKYIGTNETFDDFVLTNILSNMDEGVRNNLKEIITSDLTQYEIQQIIENDVLKDKINKNTILKSFDNKFDERLIERVHLYIERQAILYLLVIMKFQGEYPILENLNPFLKYLKEHNDHLVACKIQGKILSILKKITNDNAGNERQPTDYLEEMKIQLDISDPEIDKNVSAFKASKYYQLIVDKQPTPAATPAATAAATPAATPAATTPATPAARGQKGFISSLRNLFRGRNGRVGPM